MTSGRLNNVASAQGKLSYPAWLRSRGWSGTFVPAGICVLLVLVQRRWPAAAYLFTPVLIIALYGWIIGREFAIDRLAAWLGGWTEQKINPDATTPIARLNKVVAATVAQLELVRHRLPQRHPITGMDTRDVLIDAIDSRRPEDPLSFLGIIEVLDFDRLCAFDAQGADQVLKAIASRLTTMVGPNRTIVQVDRARFAVWFSATPLNEARSEFNALCYALRNRVTADTIDLLPQFAHGFACEDTDRLAAKQLLDRAISNLISVTEDGVDEIADPTDAARQRFVFEQGLRQAIDRREFELLYQPFVRADRQRVCGAEALLRWHSAEHGFISPAVFIPIVEGMGLAEQVGTWVLNTACEEATNWPKVGFRDFKIAVNLSALQLARGDFDVVVQRLLRRHAMSSGALELELTESVAAGKTQGLSDLFRRLRALGVSMSIDDFGTGYSSLSYLKNLKFDKLKIDREFVSTVDRQTDSQAICQSIITLGRGLGIEVLAEGVETWDEYAWLRRHGCTLFQGYYFSKPLTSQKFTEFARDHENIRNLTDVGPAALRNQIYEKLA